MATGSDWLVVTVSTLSDVALKNLTQFKQNNNCKKCQYDIGTNQIKAYVAVRQPQSAPLFQYRSGCREL